MHRPRPTSPSPSPAPPTTASAPTCTPSNVDLVLRVGRDRHLLRQRDARSRSGRRGTGRRRPSASVRASTSSRSAAARTARAASRRRARSRRRRRSRSSCDALRAEAAAGLEPRRRDDRLARRDPRAATPRFCSSVPARSEHARAHHRAHEVRRRRQRAAELLVDDGAVEHRHPASRRTRSGSISPMRSSSAELLPELGRVADRVVLQRAHRRRAPRSALHTPRTISRSISCSAVKSRSIVQLLASGLPAGRRGGSRGCRRSWSGAATRAVQSVLQVAVDRERHERRVDPAAAGVVGLDRRRPCPRAPSCRRGTPSPSCGTSCGRAGPSGPVQSVR